MILGGPSFGAGSAPAPALAPVDADVEEQRLVVAQTSLAEVVGRYPAADLPAAAMLEIQSPWPVRDNRRVTSLERGELAPASLAEPGFDTAVQGSGGGYLSNEVSYLSVLLLGRMNAAVPVGHLHTPSVVGHDADIEGRILAQIRTLLGAAISANQADDTVFQFRVMLALV